jgi:hypothetical protein
MSREAAHLMGTLAPGMALRPAVETIETAAGRVLTVTSGLRTFANPPKIDLQPVWVNQIVSGLAATWKNIRPALTLLLDTDPRPAHANSHELTRVLEAILNGWRSGCGCWNRRACRRSAASLSSK